MSLFDAGRDILATIAEAAAEEIVFRASDGIETTLRARIGKKLFKVADNSGIEYSVAARRFIVHLEDLPHTPINGEAIIWNNTRYKLGCPDGGPPWRWHGNDGKDIAIYTLEFGEEL